MNESHLEEIFQSLGSLLRIRILRYVASTNHSLPHIAMIADHLGISGTLCTRHVQKLVKCGLLNEYPQSQYKLIEINPSNFSMIEEFLNSLKGASHGNGKISQVDPRTEGKTSENTQEETLNESDASRSSRNIDTNTGNSGDF